MVYVRRVIDDVLDEVLPDLGAIAIEGAKGVGKTATASERAHTVISLEDPGQREAVMADPVRLTTMDPPVLLDEWQLEPHLWDQVRRAVDTDPAGGRFLLTGSAGIGPEVQIHSGAGRIVKLAMRPLALSERGLIQPTVSLRRLLNGGADVEGASSVELSQYVDEILASGFPGIRPLAERARQLQLDGYLARVVDREMPLNDITVRRPNELRAWLRAYAAATSTTASYSTILDAATPSESDKPARDTVQGYREHLLRLFILDPVEAWIPTFNPIKRLTMAPKHHLVDPALTARLVGVGRAALLNGDSAGAKVGTGTWLGALFESLATASVRVYASAANAEVGHVRTKGGEREIDLIIEGEDRSVVGVEVKLAPTVSDHDVRHLNWLKDEIGDRLVDRVVLTTGRFAYRRPDGVAVVPLALMGP